MIKNRLKCKCFWKLSIAIINNYYFGKLKYSEDPQQREWAKNVNLIFKYYDFK